MSSLAVSAGNASRKKRKLVVVRGSLAAAFADEPPFGAVARLDAGAHGARHVAALGITLALHAAIAGAVLLQHRNNERPPAPVHRAPIATSIVHAPPPPKPPPPPKAPQPPRPQARAQPVAPRAEPPPPAQAGRAIAVDGPADLTAFDLVVGTGSSYAGGTSSAQGTGREAVHEEAQIGSRGKGGAPPPPDLSRPAGLLGHDWSCPWPDEAQDSDLRDARVSLRVRISASGEPQNVDILAAPAQGGFSDAARHCALLETYRPALDASGAPIATDKLFNVHFLR